MRLTKRDIDVYSTANIRNGDVMDAWSKGLHKYFLVARNEINRDYTDLSGKYLKSIRSYEQHGASEKNNETVITVAK